MSDARQFARDLHAARRAYAESEDFNAYLADCVYVALRVAADELAARDSRLTHLGTGLSVARYAIKGLVDQVADRLYCPVEAGHGHEDFLTEFSAHAKRFLDRDTQPVKNILVRLGL